MGKWTKGPWLAEDRGNSVVSGEYRIVSPDGDEVPWNIAVTAGGLDEGEGEPTALANANLIAAAPDLADALECCLGLLTGNMDGNWDLGDPVDMASAALKKAKGEA